MTAYHVVWECVVAVAVVRCASYDAHLATATATTHSHTTCFAATTSRLQIRIEL